MDKVIFRKFKGEIIAIILNTPFDRSYKDNKKYVMVYSHFGQHGYGDYEYLMENSKPAKKEEYKELKKEMETLFHYNIEEVNENE